MLLAVVSAAAPTGFARRAHRMAAVLAAGLRRAASMSLTILGTPCACRCPGRAAEVADAAHAAGISRCTASTPDTLGISCSELTTAAHLRARLRVRRAGRRRRAADERLLSWFAPATTSTTTAPGRRRDGGRRCLADADLGVGLQRHALGSCTMKLNAVAEMEPITWPGFADLHPFAPTKRRGYPPTDRGAGVLARRVTGYAAARAAQRGPGRAGGCSRSAPTTGRRRHQRDVCLIPQSAHGTNAASAVMAGMRVVWSADADGDVDLDDLRAKCDEAPRTSSRRSW